MMQNAIHNEAPKVLQQVMYSFLLIEVLMAMFLGLVNMLEPSKTYTTLHCIALVAYFYDSQNSN